MVEAVLDGGVGGRALINMVVVMTMVMVGETALGAGDHD